MWTWVSLFRLNDRLCRNDGQLLKKAVSIRADYSIVKGVIYTLIAIVCLLADATLLLEVAGQFSHANLSSQGADGKLVSVYSLIWTGNWRLALSDYWQLFCLTVAVVLTGMFLKVWRDVLEDRGRSKRDIWLFNLVLAFAGVILLAMAVARATVPVGGQHGALGVGSWVSAVLGLTLPVVSAGFFIKGYEAFARRYRLLRTSCHARAFDLAHWVVQKLATKHSARIRDLESKETALRAEDHFRKMVHQAIAEFDSGYDEGIQQLLSTGSLVERLRRLAVTHSMRGEGRSALRSVVLPVLLALYLSGVVAVRAETSSKPTVNNRHAVIVLFDPTCGGSKSGDRIQKQLTGISEYLAKDARIGNILAVFSVSRDVYDSDPDEIRYKRPKKIG